MSSMNRLGWKVCTGSYQRPTDVREARISNIPTYKKLEGKCPVCERWISLTGKEKLFRHRAMEGGNEQDGSGME